MSPAESTASTKANAFVGPRPFPVDRRLYGRDRELLALTHRLMSERLVLMYSPSGAGKTSLIQGQRGLRERMADKGFRPLPAIRVSHESTAAADAGVNRYLLSTVVALEEERPPAERRSPKDLAAILPGAGIPAPHFLDAHLTALAAHGGGDQPLLVFDQFEELLTLDPTDDLAKRLFLRQVGVALSNPDRWALFSMREDHIAALEPYLPLLPTRLAATFRLDLLGLEAAKSAVQGPAAEFGVSVDDDVAERLVRELAEVQVIDANGRPQTKDGTSVEPLHLQVVCQRLWKVRELPDRITEADLERSAGADASDRDGVTTALRDYYESGVRQVADAGAEFGVTERSVRDLIEFGLIPDGRRVPFPAGGVGQFGLPASVWVDLANVYLVRSESRLGGVWYELSHDRLIEPVQQSNLGRLAAWQRTARMWHRGGARDEILPQKAKLEDAVRQADKDPSAKTAIEAKFLARCREHLAQRLKDRKANRTRNQLLLSSLALVVALVAIGTLVRYNRKLNDATNQARVSTLMAKALATEGTNPDLSLAMAFHALEHATGTGTENQELGRAFRRLIEDNRGRILAPTRDGPAGPDGGGVASHVGPIIGVVATKESNDWIVTAGHDGRVLFWDLEAAVEGRVFPAPRRLELPASVTAIALSVDERWLAVTGGDKELTLYQMPTKSPEAGGEPACVGRYALQTTITALRVFTTAVPLQGDPPGIPSQWLAGTGADSKIYLWRLPLGDYQGPAAGLREKDRPASGRFDYPIVLDGHDGLVTSLEPSPAPSRWLASGGTDQLIWLWDLEKIFAKYVAGKNAPAWPGEAVVSSPRRVTDAVKKAADRELAEVGYYLRRWEGAEVSDLVFWKEGDGQSLALISAFRDGTVRIHDLEKAVSAINTRRGADRPAPERDSVGWAEDWGFLLKSRSLGVVDLAVAKSGSHLLSGDLAGGVLVWDLARVKHAIGEFRSGKPSRDDLPGELHLAPGSFVGLTDLTSGKSNFPITDLDITNDAQTIAGADMHGRLRVWRRPVPESADWGQPDFIDLSSRASILFFLRLKERRPDGPVAYDGAELLLAVCDDGKARLWPVRSHADRLLPPAVEGNSGAHLAARYKEVVSDRLSQTTQQNLRSEAERLFLLLSK